MSFIIYIEEKCMKIIEHRIQRGETEIYYSKAILYCR